MEAIRLKYKVGTKAFIIESRLYIREVQVIRFSNGFYTVKFANKDGAIKVRKSRLYESREKAEHIIGIDKEIMVPAKRPLRSPHTYEW